MGYTVDKRESYSIKGNPVDKRERWSEEVIITKVKWIC